MNIIPNPEDLFEKCKALHVSDQLDEALECYNEVTRIQRDHFKAWANKGVIFFQQGEHKEAIKCFEKALEIKPDSEPVWYNTGNVFLALQAYQQALECYDKTIRLNPNNADAWNNKGIALGHLTRYKEALECINQALEIKPGDTDILYNAGINLQKWRKYDKAIKCFDEVLKTQPDFGRAWFSKGNALYDLGGHDEEAIQCYNKAIYASKDFIAALINKGNALYRLEMYAESLECFNTFLSERSEDHAYLGRGMSNYALGHYSDALVDFNRISNNNLKDRKAINIGQCYYKIGFYEDAEENYRTAIKSNPKLIEAYYNLAVLYTSEKKYDKATKLLETTLRIDRNFSKARAAIKQLEKTNQLDWSSWWFESKQDKKIASKRLFGSVLVAAISALITLAAYLAFQGKLTESSVAGLIAMTGFLIGILLLPSLKAFKVAGVELETESIEPKAVLLEPVFAPLQRYTTVV